VAGLAAQKRVPFILFVGRVLHVKGLDVLIEAFSRVSNAYPEWHLSLVGPLQDEAYYRELQQRITRLRLQERVEFIGEQYGNDMYRWYFLADIFCLPSRHEGMSNALTEAMFFGKPIIASQVGQTDYQLDNGRCGIIVTPDSTEELASNLMDLIAQPSKREQLGSAARKRAHELFLQ
jgi:glycosyltransferase involved in cell wall biosynthesis